ncbi:hypothetical protein, partial [Enterobacter bugandensis]|uniref:hypothetical protein n=1 Tax=Enterobacter bugandensis TaxID=881260 RepID=UPI003344C838
MPVKASDSVLQTVNSGLKFVAVDSIGQRNNHVKTCGCGGSFDETYIYSKRKIARFRLVEEWD